MELAIRIFVVLHLIGFASLLGGILAQTKELRNGGRISPSILHGAWTLLITGFVLVGLVEAGGEEHVNNLVLAAKSVIITVIFFLAYGNSKKEQLKKWVVPVIALLAITNLTLAVVVGMTTAA